MFCIFKVLLPFLSGWRLQVFVLHSNCWLINRHRSIGPKHLLPVRLLKLFGRGHSSHHPLSTRGSNCKINSFSSHFCGIKQLPMQHWCFSGLQKLIIYAETRLSFPSIHPRTAKQCWDVLTAAARCHLPNSQALQWGRALKALRTHHADRHQDVCSSYRFWLLTTILNIIISSYISGLQ